MKTEEHTGVEGLIKKPIGRHSSRRSLCALAKVPTTSVAESAHTTCNWLCWAHPQHRHCNLSCLLKCGHQRTHLYLIKSVGLQINGHTEFSQRGHLLNRQGGRSWYKYKQGRSCVRCVLEELSQNPLKFLGVSQNVSVCRGPKMLFTVSMFNSLCLSRETAGASPKTI